MSEITIWDIILVFRYRWKLFLSIFFSVLILSVLYIFLAKPRYEVKAVVKANIYNPYIRGLVYTGLVDQRLIPMTPVDKIGSEIALLKSRAILGKVIFDLGLNLKFRLPEGYSVIYKRTLVDTIPEFHRYELKVGEGHVGVFKDGSQVCGGLVGDTIDCGIFEFALSGGGNGSGNLIYKKPSDVYNEWKDKVYIDQEGLTDLIDIIVNHDSVELSKEVANRMALTYVNFNIELERKIISKIRSQLRVLLDSTNRNLNILMDSIVELKRDSLSVIPFALDAMTHEAVAEVVKKYLEQPQDPELVKFSKVFPEKQFKYHDLYSRFKTVLRERDTLLMALHEADLKEANTVSPSYIVAWASIPSKPVWPRKKLILLVAVVLGAILALMGVLIYDAFDRKVQTPLQVKRLFSGRYPVLSGTKSLLRYLLLNGYNRVFCREEVPGMETVNSIDEADAVCIDPRGKDIFQLLREVNAITGKPIIFFFK